MSKSFLRREVFSTSRVSEFFERKSLQAMTGQPADRFADVVVKELLDNGLDAAEAAGVAPSVRLAVAEEDAGLTVTVADNGPGISPDLVERVTDFGVLVSDKAAYRSPTRGLQGNGWKTLLAIPHALGGTNAAIIESFGVRHAIRAWVDPAGEVAVKHDQEPCPWTDGTTVTVDVPDTSGCWQRLSAVSGTRWARGFALFNPHVLLSYQGKSEGGDELGFYKPTVGAGWRKPWPTDPTSAHWYDEPSLSRLVFSHIAASKRGGRDLPLGEFVRSFAGLASSMKAKAVRASLPSGLERLSDFEADPVAVAVVLEAMKRESREPTPASLGKVPEDHYRSCYAEWYGLRRLFFKRIRTIRNGLPWVVEIALAETEEPGELFYGVNFSPTFDDPFARLKLSGGDLTSTGVASMLQQIDAYPDGTTPRAAAIHLICPALEFLDKGKSTLAVQ